MLYKCFNKTTTHISIAVGCSEMWDIGTGHINYISVRTYLKKIRWPDKLTNKIVNFFQLKQSPFFL